MPRNQTAAPVLTAAEARARIQQQGITITEWARQRGYNRHNVYEVLNGIIKAHYGRAHRIAVDLGMKPSITDENSNLQTSKVA